MRLSREEKEILFNWGSEDYGLTVSRLAQLAALTIDSRMKQIICGLHDRLFCDCTEKLYGELYSTTRKENKIQRRKGLKVISAQEDEDE